ncbi:MAG TPA: ATP-grasp domain-containing protein [Gemmatimonadaceae bacterium]|nr:ATP-grasp domain-containing protein [Gemmatimonadaceae bacterium]
MTRAILVTDGDERSALAVVRSLGKAGHKVYVCSTSGRSIAGASRQASGERKVSPSLTSPDSFARELGSLISLWGIDVLVPMTEQAFNAVFANRELFRNVSIPAASSDKFRAISDKRLVTEAAAACGLAVPAQIVLATPADAAGLADGDLHFPMVVKPARSVAQRNGTQFKLGVIHCRDRVSLRSALDRLPPEAYPLLLQQRIVGPGVGIFLLLWDNELVASFAHRRLREKPPAGGVSVYRESIAGDPVLVERSRRLLDRFGWSGVAMIEYKVDEKTGTPFIMEINGRFWGSLQLAIDAGVDFPRLLIARASGEKVYGPSEYKLGIRSKWEWGEVDYALARLRRTDAELSLPPGSSGRLRSLLRLFVPWVPGDRFEVFRASDPAPFFRETIRYFRAS